MNYGLHWGPNTLRGAKDSIDFTKILHPMTLKMNYSSFKDSNEIWFNVVCLYINDFCEILKCFTYSFIDIKTWVKIC